MNVDRYGPGAIIKFVILLTEWSALDSIITIRDRSVSWISFLYKLFHIWCLEILFQDLLLEILQRGGENHKSFVLIIVSSRVWNQIEISFLAADELNVIYIEISRRYAIEIVSILYSQLFFWIFVGHKSKATLLYFEELTKRLFYLSFFFFGQLFILSISTLDIDL